MCVLGSGAVELPTNAPRLVFHTRKSTTAIPDYVLVFRLSHGAHREVTNERIGIIVCGLEHNTGRRTHGRGRGTGQDLVLRRGWS